MDGAVRVFVRKSGNLRHCAPAADSVEEIEKRQFALAANRIGHVFGIEGSVRIVGSKVPSPDDRQVRKASSKLTATRDSADGLRAGHHRDGDEFYRTFSN